MSSVVDKFLRYVKIDTQSWSPSDTFPSTEKQKDLGRLLTKELQEMGASDVKFDEQFGYVYATIPSTLKEKKTAPVLGFIAHMDTAMAVSGKNVKPRIVENYPGGDIVLNEALSIVMKAEDGDPNKAIYHSVLITNSANSDINSIEDIKGRTMAFVDPDSTSGNLVPTAEIIQAFPDEGLNSDMLHTNGDFFEAVSYSGSHQAGLQAVVKGDVDVAPISDQILASEIANGNAAEGDVKIIHESGAIPAEAMVVAEHVDAATREMLTEFLTSYENEQYFTDVIKLPGARFIACDMSDYEEIIELNKIINEF